MIRRILMGLGVIACAVALSGCILMSGPSPVPQGSESASSASAAAANRPVTHAVVGEKLSAGMWTVTVEESERTGKGVGGAKPAAGSEFLLVTVGFENKGTDALEVRAQDFELTDPAGAVVSRVEISKAAYNASSMRPLMPRFGTSTVFVYQVPKGSVRYAFAFSPPGIGKQTRLEWRVP